MEPTTIYFLIAIIAVLVNLIAIVFIAKKFSQKLSDIETSNKENDSFLMLQQQLDQLRNSFDEKITDTTKHIHTSLQQQFSENMKVIKDITGELAKLGETNKQVINFTEQIKKLEQTLTNPKQRGVLGEYYLEAILQNVFTPGDYQMQYTFKDGTKVDAIIKVKDKIIPIDSKFSLENYNKMINAHTPEEKAKYEKAFLNDIKTRVLETAKYIKPSEGTLDFAFMFIPSEAIYYDLLANTAGEQKESLLHYSMRKYKVIIVSPTNLLAYLQTVLQGLKALAIEEKAQEIVKNVEKLAAHMQKHEEYYKKLGNQITTVVNTYTHGYKEFAKIDKDVLKITGNKIGVEPQLIEKPQLD